MRNISDLIEQHLKLILQASKSQIIEIQRSELANQFQCVPSQINYVISTRFTVEKGYIVESKRGGGGYIRIRKVDPSQHQSIYKSFVQSIGDVLSQSEAEGIIYRLKDSGEITEREAQLMNTVIHRETLLIKLPARDQLRAHLMKSMLIVFLQ
jgi:transcriptional regulator CtsR